MLKKIVHDDYTCTLTLKIKKSTHKAQNIKKLVKMDYLKLKITVSGFSFSTSAASTAGNTGSSLFGGGLFGSKPSASSTVTFG